MKEEDEEKEEEDEKEEEEQKKEEEEQKKEEYEEKKEDKKEEEQKMDEDEPGDLEAGAVPLALHGAEVELVCDADPAAGAERGLAVARLPRLDLRREEVRPPLAFVCCRGGQAATSVCLL